MSLIAISYFVSVYLVLPRYSAQMTVDSAIGQLARAESAQTPAEVIYYVKIAKDLLPHSGSVVWWSPEKANFESIQSELDDLISRARNISSLELENELFNSEMYAIHAEIRMIQETLVAF